MVVISDATLRDGNHAMRHQLTAPQIRGYAYAADEAGLDILEVGHGNGLGASSCLLGQSATSDRTMLEVAREALKTTRLGVHFIPGFGKSSDIAMALDIGVDVVRVATHCTEANTSARFIKQVRQAGKTAFGVLMMSHMAPQEVLLSQARLMESYGAEAIILMDSAGYSTPSLVKSKVRCLVDGLYIKVGFHAHNNLGLAVANSLTALEEGASIIDACINGLGAGAGNTQLETLIAALERDGYSLKMSFEDVIRLSRCAGTLLDHKTPHIPVQNITSGLYGLFSGFVPHIQNAAKQFNVNEFDLCKKLCDRRLVAGQEDIIFEEAGQLASTHNSVS